MKINSPPETHRVDDYDFNFSNGLFMSITVDKEAGDTIEEPDTHTRVFKLSEKPSRTQADTMLPPEEVSIYMPHVLSVTHRTRLQTAPTKEQSDEFQKTLHKLTGTLQ